MTRSTLSLYRTILRAAQVWPSTRRAKVIEEIRAGAPRLLCCADGCAGCRVPRVQRANGAERTRRVPRESARARAGEGGRDAPAGGGGPRRPSIAGKPAGPRHRPGHLIHVRGREPRAWLVTHSCNESAALRRASRFTLRRPVYSCRVPAARLTHRGGAPGSRRARPRASGRPGSERLGARVTRYNPGSPNTKTRAVHSCMATLQYTFVRADDELSRASGTAAPGRAAARLGLAATRCTLYL